MKLQATKDVVDGRIIISARCVGNGMKMRGGWSLGDATSKKNQGLAERLAKAINCGVAFKNVCVKKDIYGVEYLTGDFQFLMRIINAELKRAGF